MVLSFGAKNFFCFHEGLDVSFELSQNCPNSISQGQEVAKVTCVKGANASGKTNALKILPTIGQFCSKSFSLKPDEEIKIETFFNNVQPAEFYLEYTIDSIRYHYELTVTRKKVISERLYRTIKRDTLIIERLENKFTKCISEYNELKKVKLRSNASFISTAYQYEMDSINKQYYFFGNIIGNVSYLGLSDRKLRLANVTRSYHRNPNRFKFIKNLILDCDLGIHDIEIRTRKNDEGQDIYYPVFLHKVKEKIYYLDFYHQSNGTKALYLNLMYYWIALYYGGILVMDEFDINFHPHILPKLVKLFTNSKSNPLQAQFLFTTHNSEIMDIMGKYRTVFINKDDNESYGYRLDEIPGDILRNDRSILPVYNAGKIGGVPRI